jgi:hypothetical protein
MRLVRTLALSAGLIAGGCIMTSGQFTVPFALDSPLDIPGPINLLRQQIDLNDIETYRDHKENLEAVVDAAIVGEVENRGGPVEVEVWMTPAVSNHLTASDVRSDLTAVRLWGPLALEAQQTIRVDWDDSAGLFGGRQALIAEVQGDGILTLYVIGPDTGTYHFVVREGVLVVVIDAGL